MPARSLTDAYVKAARCETGKRVLEIRDTDVRGLELRVLAGGTKSWRLHYTRRSDGRRRAIALGTYPSVPLKEARRKAKAHQTQIEDENVRADPADARRARKAADTFKELADDWLELHAKPNKSARAVVDDESMLKRHVLPEIGSMRAVEVTKRDVIRLLDTVAAKGDARQEQKSENGTPRKPKAARRLTHRPNRVFELVRAIFRWAIGRDVLKADPTFGVSPPIKKEKPRERELSADEIRTLWLALDRAPVGRTTLRRKAGDFPMRRATALAIKLALVTAQRIGEVSGIALTELDLNDTAPMWVIPGERTKNGQPNRVPLSPAAVRLIAEAKALAGESAWLFPSPKGDGAVDAHAATKALERARPDIGIADIRVHDLRRTAATRMAELGVNPHTVSLVLNHVSVRRGTITGRVYDRYSYDREKREALGSWGARLERILAGADGRNVTALIAPTSIRTPQSAAALADVD
jgi:integrase